MSITVAWAPAAYSAPSAVTKQESLSLTPSTGPPGSSVHISFTSCAAPGYISGIKWDEDYVDFSATGQPGGADFSVPTDATAATVGPHDVTARCYKGAYATGATTSTSYATGTFTVTAPADPEIILHPTEGAPETSVTVSGSGFNCSYVDVAWDDTQLTGADVTSDAKTITTEFSVPTGSAETTHTVRAACTDYPDRSATADFTVTGSGTNGTGTTGETDNGSTTGNTTGETNGSTTGNTTGNTNGDSSGNTTGSTNGDTNGTGNVTGDTNGTNHGSTTIPTGWVVGPSLFGTLLLLAALVSLLNRRHRGPRWVHDHIRAALRPGAGTVALQERRDTGSANRAIRLEPHADPGDQRLY
ncbi:hypothetical protein [Streptomyces sp. NPDC023838]|uniref:hypothetical protein n=1 Tax=Streptomyces sp. NPDC023838 TaxID=3154325 RepID=UPI0033F75CD3